MKISWSFLSWSGVGVTSLLIIIGIMFFGRSATISNLAICTYPQQDVCSTETPELIKNEQKLYLSGEHQYLKDGTEFTVNFKPKSTSQTAKVIDGQVVKARVQEETFLLEIDSQNLTPGTYQLSLVNDEVTLPDPSVKNLTVWAGKVQDLVLCSQPQQNGCSQETTAFVKNEPKLYLSGEQQQLKEGTEFILDLNYFPEPGQKTKSEQKIVKAKVDNQSLLLELTPKELPVGTYQLNISSNEQLKFINDVNTKEFTVWDSQEDAQARLGNKLARSNTSLQKLSLCDRSNFPPPNLKQSPSNPSEEQDAEIIKDDPTFCLVDSNTFSSKMTDIGFRLTFNNIEDRSKLKIIWKYNGAFPQKNIVNLTGATNALNYTLSSPQGFLKGNYELILALENQNAKPIYRRFKVQ